MRKTIISVKEREIWTPFHLIEAEDGIKKKGKGRGMPRFFFTAVN